MARRGQRRSSLRCGTYVSSAVIADRGQWKKKTERKFNKCQARTRWLNRAGGMSECSFLLKLGHGACGKARAKPSETSKSQSLQMRASLMPPKSPSIFRTLPILPPLFFRASVGVIVPHSAQQQTLKDPYNPVCFWPCSLSFPPPRSPSRCHAPPKQVTNTQDFSRPRTLPPTPPRYLQRYVV